MTEQEYRDAPGVSRSFLSEFDDNPRNVIEPRERVESDAFRIGSAFDAMMFQTPEEWNNRYFVSEHEPPTGMMGNMVKAYIKEVSTDILENFTDEQKIERAFSESGYKDSYKKTALKQFESFRDYAAEQVTHEGKDSLSLSEYDMLVRMQYNCLNNEVASKFFKSKSDKQDLLFQLPVFWEQSGTVCKALLDVVMIDHEAKKIYPVDLKTTSSSIYYFSASFIKYKYYLQSSMYSAAIEDMFSNLTSEGYTIENFKFIVVSTTGRNDVLTYTVSDADMNAGHYGYTDIYGNYKRGWITLLEDLNWHYESDLWHYHREVYSNNMDMPLNCTSSWKEQLLSQ